MGANPHASQGSLLACPDVMGEIDGIRERGGKVVVDRPPPHRHRRAGRRVAADHARAPTPRCCSRSSTCCSPRGWSTSATLADLVDGVDEVARAASPTSRPSAVAARHRHPRRAHPARSPASSPRAERAVVYGRIGLCNQEFGTLASWLVDVVNILTGHFDRPGGLMFPRPGGVVASPTLPMPELDRRRAELRPLEQPGARRARGARPGAGVVPGRGDRHARRRARSGRCSRSPATRCFARPSGDRLDDGAGRARLHDQRRQLAQRDHPPRPRDPARAVAARAAPLRRPASGSSRCGSAANCSPADLPAGRRPARGVGDPHPPRRRLPRACRRGDVDVGRHRRRLLRRAVPRPRASTARRSRARLRRTAGPSGCSTSRCAPARSATATARSPTGSRSSRSRPRPHGIDLGPDGAARCAEVLAHRRRARSSSRPPYITADLPRLARAARPRPPTSLVLVSRRAPALEQLVDAQRQGAGEGQGPLHAARPPRRRRPHRPRRRRARHASRSEAGSVEVPVEVSDEHRCRASCPCPTAGATTSPAPACRSPASTPASTTTCSRPAPSSTCSPATPPSTASRSPSPPPPAERRDSA